MITFLECYEIPRDCLMPSELSDTSSHKCRCTHKLPDLIKKGGPVEGFQKQTPSILHRQTRIGSRHQDDFDSGAHSLYLSGDRWAVQAPQIPVANKKVGSSLEYLGKLNRFFPASCRKNLISFVLQELAEKCQHYFLIVNDQDGR
jgi:hypothetical protein